jgi:hypothetical protein
MPDNDLSIDGINQEVEALRQAFDRFFQGIEKRPPQPQREKLEKQLNRMLTAPNMRAVERFRLRQLRQRMNSYARLWDRVLRGLEEGTLRRDSGRPLTAPQAKPKPAPKSGDEATYERFAAALEQSGGQAPSRASFLEKLGAKRREIEAKHGVNVRFEVGEKGGKPTLKTVADK